MRKGLDSSESLSTHHAGTGLGLLTSETTVSQNKQIHIDALLRVTLRTL